MPADRSKLRQLWRRMLIIGVAFLAAGVMLVVYAARQDQRQQSQYEAARNAGCLFVSRERGLEWRLRMWYATGEYPEAGTSLILTSEGPDKHWLRKHDWLNGLNVVGLHGADAGISAEDLARFIDVQPLVLIELGGYPLDDQIMRAIRTKDSLTMLSLRNRGFGDADLASLPLERYECLILSESPVTPAGLQELRRCRRLSEIELDGNQLTAEVAAILDEVGTVHRVILSGPDVTDEHLQLISRIRGLDHVSLSRTSITAEGRSKLLKAKPACKIWPPRVASTLQAETDGNAEDAVDADDANDGIGTPRVK